MSSASESSKAANQPSPQNKLCLSRTFGWLAGKKEQEPKDVSEEYPPPSTPLSINRRNNNPEDFDPACTSNVSGMFYRLINTGMEPYEARELLMMIMKDSDEQSLYR